MAKKSRSRSHSRNKKNRTKRRGGFFEGITSSISNFFTGNKSEETGVQEGDTITTGDTNANTSPDGVTGSDNTKPEQGDDVQSEYQQQAGRKRTRKHKHKRKHRKTLKH